jgi:DNA polymerase-1
MASVDDPIGLPYDRLRGRPLAVVLAPGQGVGFAWEGGSLAVPSDDPASVVSRVAACDPRWVWWLARETARPLLEAGVRPRTCWDLGAVARLLWAARREEPDAVWAAAHGLPSPPPEVRRPALPAGPSLFEFLDVDEGDDGPIGSDGLLSRRWVNGHWAATPQTAQRWAELALQIQQLQAEQLAALPDSRSAPRQPPLPLLTALSESAAALLAVELGLNGLPLDIPTAESLLRDSIGERPRDGAHEQRMRQVRDQAVLQHAAGEPVDLRSPAQVKQLLARVGLDLPDTRSWRLEPHAATSPLVAALLTWRKAERVATTYGYGWLDRCVERTETGGRLRGEWRAADGAGGRMTASAGLHNLPAELRSAIRADPGFTLVRADLGQIEPRVLAAVSGDDALAAAAREDDMYAPVAAALRCDRPTAKVAVLAAMYGQTSGAAGAALRDMDRTYPTAMAYLRAAEAAGREGRDLRTYGGRLLPLSAAAASGELPQGAYGRFARNAVIQGAAAELFKAWAATVRDGLRNLPGRPGAAIVLCLHDELLLHVPIDSAGAAIDVLRTSLAGTAHWWAAGSAVRFLADISTGPDWASAH